MEVSYFPVILAEKEKEGDGCFLVTVYVNAHAFSVCDLVSLYTQKYYQFPWVPGRRLTDKVRHRCSGV